MLSFTTRAFEAADARTYVALAESAFSIAPPGARPTDSAELVAHWHGDANPAGRAVVTLAHAEGRAVGHVSGLPARFRRSDGRVVIGWQIGCFVVDASVQRQGVGRGLLEAITADLAQRKDDFVYTYPNPRSIGVFLKHGYARIGRAPTWIACPAPLRSGTASRIDARSGTWDVERLDAQAMRAALAARGEGATGERATGGGAPGGGAPGGEARGQAAHTKGASGEHARDGGAFVRDRAYFGWRALHAEADARYRFVMLEQRSSGQMVALALGDHRFNGLRFTILVDAWPDVIDERLDLLVRAAGGVGASRLVYLNTNRSMRGAGLRLRVPLARDPRPVELLHHPGGSVGADELARAPAITADWMGF